MRTIGPLTGADALANRQPPNAARQPDSVTTIRMKVCRAERDNYFFNDSRMVFAAAASGAVGSTSTALARRRAAPALSPFFMAASPSFSNGFAQNGSVSDAFANHVAAASAS